MRVTYLNIEDR